MKIFGTMIGQKLQDFDEDVKPLGDVMAQVRIITRKLQKLRFATNKVSIGLGYIGLQHLHVIISRFIHYTIDL